MAISTHKTRFRFHLLCTSPDGLFDGLVTVVVNPNNKNELIVTVETTNFSGSIGNLKNSMQVFVNAIADAGNYYNGSAVEIRLHECIHNSQKYEFVSGSIELKNQSSERTLKPSELIKVFHKSENLMYASSNFRKALKYGEDRAFFCYRSIESVRNHFFKITNSREVSWDMLRNELNIDRAVIDLFKGFADEVRHGGVVSYSDDENAEMLGYTVRILDRFILYVDDPASFVNKNFPLFSKS